MLRSLRFHKASLGSLCLHPVNKFRESHTILDMSLSQILHLHRILHGLHPGSRVHGLLQETALMDALIHGVVHLVRLQ